MKKILIKHDGKKFLNKLITSKDFNLVGDLTTGKIHIKKGQRDSIDDLIIKTFSSKRKVKSG